MNLTHHEESSPVVVLLHEFVFSFGALVGDEFGVDSKFISPLFLRHVSQPVNLKFFSLQPKKRIQVFTNRGSLGLFL